MCGVWHNARSVQVIKPLVEPWLTFEVSVAVYKNIL